MKAKLCHRPNLWMVDVGSPAHTTAIAEPQALCMCTGMIISVFACASLVSTNRGEGEKG